jgi:ankyrin repeat protein
MLTLKEVLADAAASPGFENCQDVGANIRGTNGESPLHWMATLGDNEGICLLVAADADADVNARDCNGNSPLHEAISMRQTSAAQVLIANGADTHLKNQIEQSPRDIALSDGYELTLGLST